MTCLSLIGCRVTLCQYDLRLRGCRVSEVLSHLLHLFIIWWLGEGKEALFHPQVWGSAGQGACFLVTQDNALPLAFGLSETAHSGPQGTQKHEDIWRLKPVPSFFITLMCSGQGGTTEIVLNPNGKLVTSRKSESRGWKELYLWWNNWAKEIKHLYYLRTSSFCESIRSLHCWNHFESDLLLVAAESSNWYKT